MRIVTCNINGIPRKSGQFALLALVLTNMLALAGCVAMYGIGRSASLTALPDLDCIEMVLQQSPEVVRVHRRQAIDEEIGYNRKGDATIYTVDYRNDTETDVRSEIRILQFASGSLSFDDLYITNNRKPKQTDIDIIRPAMLAIEQRLADKCGIQELRSNVNESCSGVVCKPTP